MDIFKTQLAQASPAVTAPIYPEKLKVKALVKDARLGKLKKDKRELEKEDYTFNQPKDNNGSNSQQQKGRFPEQEVVQLSDEARDLERQNQANTGFSDMVKKPIVQKKNKISKNLLKNPSKNSKHLDIFI